MIVRMTTHITGSRDGVQWPEIGETIEVGDQEGADLIAVGYAEAVDTAETPKASKRRGKKTDDANSDQEAATDSDAPAGTDEDSTAAADADA